MKQQTVYVAIIKATNEIIVSTTKSMIAKRLNIDRATVTRNVNKYDYYATKEYHLYSTILHKRVK